MRGFLVVKVDFIRCTGFLTGKAGMLPMVGNIANNVRPITRKSATKPSGLGAAHPILRWANSIGNQWVNDTVGDYRKAGGK